MKKRVSQVIDFNRATGRASFGHDKIRFCQCDTILAPFRDRQGWYIGHECRCGSWSRRPYRRFSDEHFVSEEAALLAIRLGTWTEIPPRESYVVF